MSQPSPPEEVAKDSMRPSLEACERGIQNALNGFATIGLALENIRENQLYRQADYGTFEKYVKGRWGWSRQHAYRLIDAAKVHGKLTLEMSTNGDKTPLPRTEAQVREMVPLADSPTTLAEVWTTAVERHGPEATAAQVSSVVAEVLPADPEPVQTEAPKSDFEIKGEWHRQRAEKNAERFGRMVSGTLVGITEGMPRFMEDRLPQALAVATEDDVRQWRGHLRRAIRVLRALEKELQP